MMIQSDKDILYNRIKNNIGFDRSRKHIKWLRENYPNLEHHHLFGSYSQKLKTSDYAILPVSREEHQKAEKDKSTFAFDNLEQLIAILIIRIKELEKGNN